MLKSMTAYGRATLSTELGRFSIEIQSVNRKHLEISVFGLPKEMGRYEVEIKKWVAASVGRGQVVVRVSLVFEKKSFVEVLPNISLAREVECAWKKIAKELRLSLDGATLLNLLARTEGILTYEGSIGEVEEVVSCSLHQVVQQALDELLTMKRMEGEHLLSDIRRRLQLIAQVIHEVEVKAPLAVERYQAKLREKLSAYAELPEHDERLLREVCLYADKVDIAEELARCHSHLKQVDHLLDDTSRSEEGVGKKLEFIIQELNREINTIGSKSSEIVVSHSVVTIKLELERIREQIQNIE